MLLPEDMAALTAWRQDRHRHPELSGHEAATAAAVVAALAPCGPDQVVAGLGGHGVAAVFSGAVAGPTVMLRAELDALPIQELPGPVHRSVVPRQAHLCGHDDHSAILLGVARELSRQRPDCGRVVLLFQPAEENGAGAAAVIADPAFAALRPDWAFALHNMPGLPLGQVRAAAGPANCASVGLRITLSGRTAHASMPGDGISPAPALAALMPALTALGPGGTLGEGFRLVTVTHARLGEPAFGIAPGFAELWVTLRTLGDADMVPLRQMAVGLAQDQARQHGLGLAVSWHDDFAACTNDPAAVDQIRAAAAATQTPFALPDAPMRASEDFGRFAQTGARAAMFLLGAGEGRPALHNPDYDFPDALIGPGVVMFHRLVRDLLNQGCDGAQMPRAHGQ